MLSQDFPPLIIDTQGLFSTYTEFQVALCNFEIGLVHRCQPRQKIVRDASCLLIINHNHTYLIASYLIERMLCEL